MLFEAELDLAVVAEAGDGTDGCGNQPPIGGRANAYMRRLTIEETYDI